MKKELEKLLFDAIDKVTIEMFEALGYGEEVILNEAFKMYRYSQENDNELEVYVIVDKDWNELLQVLESEEGFIFEEL